MAQNGLDEIIALRDSLLGSDDSSGDVGSEGIAAAGNGGVATSSANGGAVSVGDILSGGNGGSVIGVGDVYDGAVAVEGSDVSSATSLGISANGGVAVSDASGGDDNFAVDLNGGFDFVS